jgi:hypothetical protein
MHEFTYVETSYCSLKDAALKKKTKNATNIQSLDWNDPTAPYSQLIENLTLFFFSKQIFIIKIRKVGYFLLLIVLRT